MKAFHAFHSYLLLITCFSIRNFQSVPQKGDLSHVCQKYDISQTIFPRSSPDLDKRGFIDILGQLQALQADGAAAGSTAEAKLDIAQDLFLSYIVWAASIRADMLYQK